LMRREVRRVTMRGEREKRTTYPVLPGDITNTSNRYIRNLKCL
jgi:hypothetical protein